MATTNQLPISKASTIPDLSVVIASFTGGRALERCLASLAPQLEREGSTEIIVATNLPPGDLEPLKPRFPDVHFLTTSNKADVFALRSLGAKEASGRQIALLEDHVTVTPGWLAALVTAHGEHAFIAGGPVDNGNTERAYDWALYFVEYGLFMPPWREGEAEILSGINVAYDHALLKRCRPIWEEAFHENEVHDALRAAGHGLHQVPEAGVKSHLEMSFSEAAAHLFAGGRHFGHYRKSQAKGLARLFWPLVSPAVPLVLTMRIVRRVARRQPRRLWKLFVGKPYFLALLAAWSAGEALGYLGMGRKD